MEDACLSASEHVCRFGVHGGTCSRRCAIDTDCPAHSSGLTPICSKSPGSEPGAMGTCVLPCDYGALNGPGGLYVRCRYVSARLSTVTRGVERIDDVQTTPRRPDLVTCGEASPPGFSTGAISTAPASTSGSSTSGTTSTTGAADDSSGQSASAEGQSTGVLRDVGTLEDFGHGAARGLQGQGGPAVLISSLGTMKTNRRSRRASPAASVATIQEKLRRLRRSHHVRQPDWRVGRMELRDGL